MNANRPIVLILTGNPAFSREITAYWPHDCALRSNAPEFIVLDEGFSRDLKGNNYDLAIADASYYEKRKHQHKNDKSTNIDPEIDTNKSAQIESLKQALVAAAKPAIMIRSNSAPDSSNFYKLDGDLLELRGEPEIWPAMAGLIGCEILRRRHAESRAREAEQTCAVAQAEATLGRYMIEMRININNALTTVLGNAELLALEPGLPASMQAQADAIRNMALRLHEVFCRFSSIEKELAVAAREAGKKAIHATAGRS